MRYIIYSICLFLLLPLLCGCDRGFLDAKPDKSLLVPATLRDYQSILDNANDIMNRTPYLGEVASDDFILAENTIQSFQETIQNCYRWDKRIYSGISSTDWDIPYKQIFYSNVVLDGLKELDLQENLKQADNIKGMALFRRAWALYHAVQLFSEGYNPNTAGTVKGLPVRLSADVNVVSQRSTLEDTYNQILADMAMAIPFLETEQEVPTRPSKTAAYAFMARVYLTMQNYNKAKLYADSTLNIYSQLLDYNTLDSTLSFPMPRLYLTSNRHPEVIFLAMLIPNSYLGSGNNTLVDPELYTSYSSNDLRKSIFFNKTLQYCGSYIGMQTFQFSGLAVDEIYLIRAEANVRLGRAEEALKDLNTLLNSRWKKGYFEPVTVTNSTELLNVILTERRKELVARGTRWSDLKRINQDTRFAKTLKRKVDGKDYMLLPNDKRYVFPIPENEISVSGIEQNER